MNPMPLPPHFATATHFETDAEDAGQSLTFRNKAE